MLSFFTFNRHNKNYDKVINLYKNAFPEEERMPEEFILEYEDQGFIEFIVYYDEEKFIGFTIFKRFENISYLIFFAIEEEIRGKGYGTQILKRVIEQEKDNKLILAIENPFELEAENYEQRIKRFGFYLRNGLMYLPHLRIKELGYTYRVLGNKPFEPDDYIRLTEQGMGKEKRLELDIDCWKE